MGDLFHILEALSKCEGRKLLATIVHVEGSAYRKEGAMMLLTEERERFGLLSGGCLENDIAARAPLVWEEGVSQTVVYDLSAEDDLSWGQGNGCNGVVHVLLEPVDEQLTAHLRLLERKLKSGLPLIHVKKLSGAGAVTDYLFHAGRDQWFGNWSGAPPELPEPSFAGGKAGLRTLGESGDALFGNSAHTMPGRTANAGQLFVQVFEPKPRLFIFGAGPDAKPLAEFAAKTGFYVTVADWRPALCSRDNFPAADELALGPPETVAAEYPFAPRDSVVVMTHHFQHDRRIVRALRPHKLQYFGILGSKERTRRLLEDVIPDWLSVPVGLPIGAQGPAEIAISIIADVIAAARLRRESHDMGDLFGGRTQPENGSAQAVPADRRQTARQLRS